MRIEENKPDNWFDAVRQQNQDQKRTVERMPPEEESVPDEFQFDSKLIFISNLTDIPPTIDSRLSFAIQLNYNKEQALQMIESKLGELVPEYPDLTIDDKMEILNFMKKHKEVPERISFRTFLHLAVIWKSGDPNRDQWALLQLRQ